MEELVNIDENTLVFDNSLIFLIKYKNNERLQVTYKWPKLILEQDFTFEFESKFEFIIQDHSCLEKACQIINQLSFFEYQPINMIYVGSLYYSTKDICLLNYFKNNLITTDILIINNDIYYWPNIKVQGTDLYLVKLDESKFVELKKFLEKFIDQFDNIIVKG
jgi:hypothetical protein